MGACADDMGWHLCSVGMQRSCTTVKHLAYNNQTALAHIPCCCSCALSLEDLGTCSLYCGKSLECLWLWTMRKGCWQMVTFYTQPEPSLKGPVCHADVILHLIAAGETNAFNVKIKTTKEYLNWKIFTIFFFLKKKQSGVFSLPGRPVPG